MTREVKPLNVKKFMRECCDRKPLQPGARAYVVTHKVDGRLLKSIPAFVGNTDYFIVKLEEPHLLQRYMTIIREKEGNYEPKVNILRYDHSLENSIEYLEGVSDE